MRVALRRRQRTAIPWHNGAAMSSRRFAVLNAFIAGAAGGAVYCALGGLSLAQIAYGAICGSVTMAAAEAVAVTVHGRPWRTVAPALVAALCLALLSYALFRPDKGFVRHAVPIGTGAFVGTALLFWFRPRRST
jgi:hypothetical protein